MPTLNYSLPEIDPTAAFDGANDINKLATAIDSAMVQVAQAGASATYTLPAATATTLGGVKIGSNINVAADGTISTEISTYTLPAATATTLGGVKVPITGGLSVTSDGTLSINDSALTLPNNSVSTDSLEDGAVTTAKIADGAVTSAKLAGTLGESVAQAENYLNGIGTAIDFTHTLGDSTTISLEQWGNLYIFTFNAFEFTVDNADTLQFGTGDWSGVSDRFNTYSMPCMMGAYSSSSQSGNFIIKLGYDSASIKLPASLTGTFTANGKAAVLCF